MLSKTVVICLSLLVVVAITFYIVFEDEVKEYLWPKKPCKKGESCVRFCCEGKLSCDNGDFNVSGRPEARHLREDYKVLKGLPCKSPFFEEDGMWTFLEDGKIRDGYNDTIDWNNYCVVLNSTDIQLAICTIEEAVTKFKKLYPYLMLVSIPFLLLTLLIYGCIRELRNLHGKSLMAYVASLTLMYTLLVVIHFFDEYLVQNYQIACVAFGYSLMASIFMCFFWLNVMCFDIWSTFKRHYNRGSKTKTFAKYCAYAFGTPALLVSLIFILNWLRIIPQDYAVTTGIYSCSIADSIAFDNYQEVDNRTATIRQLIYIYGPICLFITINTVFYSVTACKIFSVQRETSIVQTGDSSRHARNEKARFYLYMRLFVIMGIPWIIELISWTLKNSIILHAASIINCLQGFIIFTLFVWQSKVKRMIQRRCTNMSVASVSQSRKSQSTNVETISQNCEERC